jgi:hypothetical protein
VVLSRRDPGPEFPDLIVAKIASPVDRPKTSFHHVPRGSFWNPVDAGFGIFFAYGGERGFEFLGVVCEEIRDNTEPARRRLQK